MKIIFHKKFPYDARTLIRRCGYGEIRDRRTGQTSYVRRLGQHHYPRFHVYINEKYGELFFNLHIDSKQPSYTGQTAHSGEYEGEVVEREGERIKRSIEGYEQKFEPAEKKKKGLLRRIFGL